MAYTGKGFELAQLTKSQGLGEVTKDMGVWERFKGFHKTGMGKATIYGSAAAIGIKAALIYGLYKAAQASGKRKAQDNPKKFIAG